MLELADLTLLPLRDVDRPPAASQAVSPVNDRGAETPSNLRELLQRLPGSGACGIIVRAIDEVLRLKPRLREPIDAIELRLHAFEVWGLQRCPWCRRTSGTVLYSTTRPRGAIKSRQFGVAEFSQQSPDVAIDGLGPDVLS